MAARIEQQAGFTSVDELPDLYLQATVAVEGPPLLRASRIRRYRHNARPREQPARRRHRRGRQHHHPAAGEKPVLHAGADHRTQSGRGVHGSHDGAALLEANHPRTVRELDLLRRWAHRHRPGKRRLLRQEARRPHRRRMHAARRHPRTPRAPTRSPSTPSSPANGRSTCWRSLSPTTIWSAATRASSSHELPRKSPLLGKARKAKGAACHRHPALLDDRASQGPSPCRFGGLLASSARGFRPRRPVFAQDAGGFRFHLVPDLRLRKILRLVNGFAIRAVPTSAQRGFAFDVFLIAKICDRLSFPRFPCTRQKPFTKRKILQKRRTYDRTAIGPRSASCTRHPLGKRPHSEQGGRRTVAQSGCSGEKRRSGWTNVVAPRSALLPPEPLSAPRLRPRPPSNDPPDFWRRDGQKGRSRALGQRFARMPP